MIASNPELLERELIKQQQMADGFSSALHQRRSRPRHRGTRGARWDPSVPYGLPAVARGRRQRRPGNDDRNCDVPPRHDRARPYFDHPSPVELEGIRRNRVRRVSSKPSVFGSCPNVFCGSLPAATTTVSRYCLLAEPDGSAYRSRQQTSANAASVRQCFDRVRISVGNLSLCENRLSYPGVGGLVVVLAYAEFRNVDGPTNRCTSSYSAARSLSGQYHRASVTRMEPLRRRVGPRVR